MKLLIIKPSSFGDIIQAIPVLTGLRRKWPEAQIDWLLFDEYRPLLENHPSLSHLLSFPRPRPHTCHQLISKIRNLSLEKYDLALDLQGLLRSGILTYLSGAKKRLGLRSAREGARIFYHEVIDDTASAAAERYLQALDYFNIPRAPHDFQISTPTPLPPSLKSKNYFVFHPYTRWKTKLWAYQNYQLLAESLHPATCVLIGNGPWFPCEGTNIIDLRNQLELSPLKTVLSNAKAVLSTDSGPAHLAAALGVPTIALFGATDPQKTAPVGPHVTLIKGDAPCAPCLRRHCYSDQPMQCMKNIHLANVLSKFQSL